MYELLVAFLLNSSEPLACTANYEMPAAVERHLSKQKKGIVEVVTREELGYISELFFDRVYLRGWFYREGRKIIACDIEFVIEVDKEGKLLFIWDESQRDS